MIANVNLLLFSDTNYDQLFSDITLHVRYFFIAKSKTEFQILYTWTPSDFAMLNAGEVKTSHVLYVLEGSVKNSFTEARWEYLQEIISAHSTIFRTLLFIESAMSVPSSQLTSF